MEQQNTPTPASDEINISDYFRIILRYRYLVILVFIIVLIGTIIYTARQPRIPQRRTGFFWKPKKWSRLVFGRLRQR